MCLQSLCTCLSKFKNIINPERDTLFFSKTAGIEKSPPLVFIQLARPGAQGWKIPDAL